MRCDGCVKADDGASKSKEGLISSSLGLGSSLRKDARSSGLIASRESRLSLITSKKLCRLLSTPEKQASFNEF